MTCDHGELHQLADQIDERLYTFVVGLICPGCLEEFRPVRDDFGSNWLWVKEADDE